MSIVRLEKPRIHPMFRASTHPIAAALPFVYSRSGIYAHRVRSGILHTDHRGRTHAAYRCWCGMTLLFGCRSLALLSADTNGRPVCATCEGRCVGAGWLGAREIGGRDVMFSPRTDR